MITQLFKLTGLRGINLAELLLQLSFGLCQVILINQGHRWFKVIQAVAGLIRHAGKGGVIGFGFLTGFLFIDTGDVAFGW